MAIKVSLIANQITERRVEWCVLGLMVWVMLPYLMVLPTILQALFAGLLLLRFTLSALGFHHIHRLTLVFLALTSVPLLLMQGGQLLDKNHLIAWLLWLVCLKSYESFRVRDWQILLLVLLFVCGMITAFHNGLWIGVWLLVSLCWLLYSMAILAGQNMALSWRHTWSVLILLIVPVGLAFWLLPRTDKPLWQAPVSSPAQVQTGLSDTMQPGSVAEVVQNDGRVADVVFANGKTLQPQDLYWRAIVMADFDGETWYALEDEPALPPSRPSETEHYVHYTITLYNQQTVLPLLDYPVQPFPKLLKWQYGDVARISYPHSAERRWQLQAELSPWQPDTLLADQRHRYTHLPAGNLRTHALAQSLKKQVGGDSFQLVQAALQYYRQKSFSYTLRPQSTQGVNGVDAFLFETHEGFCEHYAQSFAVLMRAAGMPARIVTGYHGGTFYPNGGFWQLRNRDAHAWVEVWIEAKQAWYRVDPTAVAISPRSEQGIYAALPEQEQSLLAPKPTFWETQFTELRFYWEQWIVQYNGEKQRQSLQKTFNFFISGSWLAWTAMSLIAFIVLMLVIVFSRHRFSADEMLNEGFMLLKLAIWQQPQNELAALTPYAAIAALQKAPTPSRLQAVALLTDYQGWRYADLPADVRMIKKWYRQCRRVSIALMKEKPLDMTES